MANQHNTWSYEIFQHWLTTLTRLYFSEQLSNAREKYAFSFLKADGNLYLLINNAAQLPLETATSSEHLDQLVQEKKKLVIQFISLYFMSMAFFYFVAHVLKVNYHFMVHILLQSKISMFELQLTLLLLGSSILPFFSVVQVFLFMLASSSVTSCSSLKALLFTMFLRVHKYNM